MSKTQMAGERRAAILEMLSASHQPLSAGHIAREMGVSRQVVVGDIALLRASGEQVVSTARGYLLTRPALQKTWIIECSHSKEGLLDELYAVVDNGGALLDVKVEHPIYGLISGTLNIRSRHDADRFANQLKEQKAAPLSLLTDGTHFHTVSCPDEETFERVLRSLSEKGILIQRTKPREDEA